MKFILTLMAVIFMFTSNAQAKLSDSVNNFSWKYFQTLDRQENIFYSPYSLTAALAVVANGATNKTQQEILTALNADSVETLNADFKNFHDLATKNYTGDRILKDSNLILINKNFIGSGINKNFQSIAKNFYRSEIDSADFENNLNGEKKKISAWVAKSTDNFISNYESLPTAETIVDLLNVIYFKGKWQIPFQPDKTREKDFTNLDGTKSKIEMMTETFDENIVYFEDEKYKAVELRYKVLENKKVVSMYLILPKNKTDLNIAESWNAETFDYKNNFLAEVKNSYIFDGKVFVQIPKVTLDIKNNLVKSFKAIGIKRAFTNNAEFFNIVENLSLKIDNATHQAKVEIDEQGTRAAAVTEITMLETTALPPQFMKRAEFIADRPFLFVIRDAETETDLFVGAVNKFS